MKKFIISTHSFDFGIGGLKVLHKLCHLLNEGGYDAYLVPYDFSQPFETYANYNVKMVTEDILNNLEDAVVIYPESWYGNYLNAPNVVRWMIGPPSEPHINTWSERDLWFWLVPYYITPKYNKNSENHLYVGEQHREVFFDQNLERTNTCWTLRKAQGLVKEEDYRHPSDSLFIPYHGARDLVGLADLYNRCTAFYCYDTYTYLTIQSLLCNTDAIVLASESNREKFLSGFALSKYVAYGVEDLPRARGLRNEFWHEIDEVEQNTMKQIHEFTQKCYDHFK